MRFFLWKWVIWAGGDGMGRSRGIFVENFIKNGDFYHIWE